MKTSCDTNNNFELENERLGPFETVESAGGSPSRRGGSTFVLGSDTVYLHIISGRSFTSIRSSSRSHRHHSQPEPRRCPTQPKGVVQGRFGSTRRTRSSVGNQRFKHDPSSTRYSRAVLVDGFIVWSSFYVDERLGRSVVAIVRVRQGNGSPWSTTMAVDRDGNHRHKKIFYLFRYCCLTMSAGRC
ncbi:hypothetical protein BJ546DRAFT_136501 [Cryomyces antarcticus]